MGVGYMSKLISVGTIAILALTFGVVATNQANAARSCVATYNVGRGTPADPPGQYGNPVGGGYVSFVAHLSKNGCYGG